MPSQRHLALIERKYISLQHAIIDNNGVECIDYPELFYPEGADYVVRNDTASAKIICRDCPIALQCADYAITAREQYGIWGGLDPAERAQFY
jgi:WhiB family redox-sensing transcriptional regulator